MTFVWKLLPFKNKKPKLTSCVVESSRSIKSEASFAEGSEVGSAFISAAGCSVFFFFFFSLVVFSFFSLPSFVFFFDFYKGRRNKKNMEHVKRDFLSKKRKIVAIVG